MQCIYLICIYVFDVIVITLSRGIAHFEIDICTEDMTVFVFKQFRNSFIKKMFKLKKIHVLLFYLYFQMKEGGKKMLPRSFDKAVRTTLEPYKKRGKISNYPLLQKAKQNDSGTGMFSSSQRTYLAH